MKYLQDQASIIMKWEESGIACGKCKCYRKWPAGSWIILECLFY